MKRALIVTILVAAAVAAGSAQGARGLKTAIIPNPGLDATNDDLQFARIKAAGASAVILAFSWGEVAPSSRRPGFNPTDPDDPQYDWHEVDDVVLLAHRHGLTPILAVQGAPAWAQGKVPKGTPHGALDGPYKPNATQFGKFARAVALRYRGSFVTTAKVHLPRVRYFVAWNEPNIYRYFTPQVVKGKDFSPAWYRTMVNAFASAVHGVHSDNYVVAGALAPFGIGRRISPMKFMREMLCMSAGPKPHPTCKRKASFDIWSHHPYTRGDPFHHAASPDDVSLADLGKMHTLLNAAVRAGQVVHRHKVQLWVDEFSYDSHPPDPSKLTVPLALHGRYVAESLYQMWSAGVTLGTWFLLRDEPVATSPFQSGLWRIGSPWGNLRKDRAKPALTAFRFPFVAYRKGASKIFIWGRTPTSTAGSVAIQARLRVGWRKIATGHAGGNGVFAQNISFRTIAKRARTPAGAKVRAVYRGEMSLPFSLKRPADRFVLAFG